jgi:membrane fusion protein, multidrug efflux system
VDSNTRNTVVRARIAEGNQAPAPGASVRVEVPVGASRQLVGIPASAVRKGPGGDHVFVLAEDDKGAVRAHVRTVIVEALRGDEVVLSGGLEAGERVAASGAFKLRESALIALAEPKPQPTAANVPVGGK